MLLTRIALQPPPGKEVHLTPSGLVDLLWLNVAPPDGIKHIHARAIGEFIEVAVFSVSSEQEISDYIVRRVCERAVRTVPILRDWLVLRRPF